MRHRSPARPRVVLRAALAVALVALPPGLSRCGKEEKGSGGGKAGKTPPAMAPARPATPDAGARPAPPRLRPALPPTVEGDFGAQLRQTYDLIFCRGKAQDPSCRLLAPVVKRFRERQLQPVQAFLGDKRPKDLPATVLYPFSGGDILSALIAFPEQTRFVLLSLEQAGSPEPLRTLAPHIARRGRERFLRHAGRLLRNTYSHTVDLQEPVGVRIPGLLPIILLGLHVHGAEVTGLRYFKITPEGRIDYFTRKELVDAGAWPRKKKPGGFGRIYSDPEYNEPYSHAEIRFKLPGGGPERVMQHIAADISAEGLARHKGVVEFLEKLEPHDLLIKAASFLLWKKRYERIRELIVAKARFLVADSSAPQPDYLKGKGFTVRTFGYFRCTVITSVTAGGKKWEREFKAQRAQPLPFAFGYRDCKRNGNVILGYRGGEIPPAALAPQTAPSPLPGAGMGAKRRPVMAGPE